jgi:glycogen debranching enzyme
MDTKIRSPYLRALRDRIDLRSIPFSDRGSRLLVNCVDGYLSIRLAERWFKLNADKISAYRDRPPLIEMWQLLGPDGQPLDLKLTTYPHAVFCETSIGMFAITFVDAETLLITLPPGRCGMRLQANLDQASTDRRGGVMRLTGQIRRSIAYTTNSKLITNRIEPSGETRQQVHLETESPEEGGSLLLNITPRLGFNRWIPDAHTAIKEAAARWHDWFLSVPEVLEAYRPQYLYAWWIMRSGLISSRFYTTREAMTPSKTYYVGVWQWDNFFHALAFRHVNIKLAQDQLRILIDHQREDGMIPDAIHDEGTITFLDFPVRADVTKPPLLGWAAWKLHQHTPDREFLHEIYEPIVRSNRWWFEQNDHDQNGLCEYHHPFSSGLDDSPLWDEGMPVEAPDLNTYLCLQQEALGRIAGEIGETSDATMWAERSKAMAERLVKKCWDEKAGLFWARLNGKPIDVRTPFSLFPLITGKMPAEIAGRLVEHLTNPQEFWSRYPVPTVALDDPKYDAHQMWRGPSWINVNYLLIEGLARSGYDQIALDLRQRTLELIAGQPDIYEYYNPETGVNPPRAASIFGWSAAIYIDLAIQATRASREAETRGNG